VARDRDLMLRSASTRWFEVLCPRDESVRAVAELARTGAVQTEGRPHAAEDFPICHLAQGLAEYQALNARYGSYWQRGQLRSTPLVEPPDLVLRRALARVHAWRRDADSPIAILQASEEELARLKLLARILGRMSESSLDFALIGESGPVLGTFCAILPRDADPGLPDRVIPRVIPWEEGHCLLLLGPQDEMKQARDRIKAVKGRIIERPPWLAGDAREALSRVSTHRELLSKRIVRLYAQLDSLSDDYDLEAVLGEVVWLDWFASHVGGLEVASQHLVWVTGWTDDLTGCSLSRALDRSGTRALLRLAPPPAGVRPPQVLDNPAWLRPFEVFTRVMGVPDSDEADPTPVLAVVVPLLFGYMFGDVGQGMVLLAAGWWLRGRFQHARLLLAGGASAVLFGLLFGSLFACEDLIPALWLHPMHESLMVLLVPLAFAVLLLSLGQLLAGLGALRRGELWRWLLTDAGFLLLYLGLVALTSAAAPLWPALLGLFWYLLGSFLVSRRLLGAFAALAHLVESVLQLLVNTLSFARVGAFALAHGALSAALVTTAHATGSVLGAALIVVMGNLLIILLEGLVVSVQTTRLVLFEFFNRFLRGTGRVFQPLSPPPALVRGILSRS
jgi:V/A-type H+-transporting ATPase subunit I